MAAQRKATYARLFRRFVWLTILCSLVPLLLVGWGINLHYTRFARERMLNFFETQVEYHRKIIEMFLNEHSSKLQLIAQTHTRDEIIEPKALQTAFEVFNKDLWSLTDLGVIGEHGYHLAYAGPYDLWSRNYAKEFWFAQVMQKGLYISDMFMGFRKEPHFIIAVTQSNGDQKWILRATINTEAFRSLVENVRIGKTGQAYLLNAEGVFQTSPRLGGAIMEKSTYPVESYHEGIQIRSLEGLKGADGKERPRQIACQAWLKNPRWLLVVKQDYGEAFGDVNYANAWTLVFLHVSALSILIVSVLITRHMITIVKRRDTEADRLNDQLMQAGKLASIGELSAGVAHEINNPLAIILTERQLLLDAARQLPMSGPEFKAQFDDSLSQVDIQIQRCKRITQNLLRFSRRTESLIETVDLNAFLREVVDLMDREARSSGIKFFTELDPALPPLLSDPSQMQQVFLNLITNAIDAHAGKPYGSVRLTTRADDERRQAKVHVADTGSGISPAHLNRIFDPFFTTKGVGKGTGLGLSIVYSIVKRLGGTISVQSEPGTGTEFTIALPYTPPKELRESLAEGHART
ncbi:MAG: two-component sensor histidine kinase [Deltaproteobacteria bacterium]|nr:two-component sensor histidine kinase [Deltaproteobacteria bacterium]